MLGGPNLELSKLIAETTDRRVTHSGGVSNMKELAKLNELSAFGVDSVIIGRALYENRFPCQKIWRIAESGLFD
jgi:phosphoribosylformimino-5-aminoimidazole carboxamide ribotide isomerase